jgi:hypothetical protein
MMEQMELIIMEHTMELTMEHTMEQLGFRV